MDTSLLAAIFADEEEDCKAKNLSKPTDQRIDELHDILSELSANAVEDSGDGSDPSPQFNGAFSDPPRSAWSSDDTPDWSSGDATTSSSEASNLNFPQFAFLQTAFPHIDTAKLRAVAIALGGPDGSPDMEDVIEEVLNREHRRECQERGIDVDTFLDGRQKNNPRVESASAKRKGGMKLVINDVRQQHHYSAGSGLGGPSRDPWTRSISLSTHLATLIPSCNPEYFQSAFHNPQHSSPCMALRYTLQKINDGPSPGNGELSEQETQYLFEMFDALRASPVYETMSVGQRDQLLSDARLSLRATNNEPNAAWELISIILDLERDLDVGIYHSAPATPLSPTILSPTSPIPKSRPNSSQWATSGSIMTSPTSPTPKSDTLGGDWNYIPERPKNEPRYLANSIPAYDPNRKARIKGVGRGRGDICEHSPMRRIAELHRNRNKVLREATRYWKGGNAGNRGGEVAQYFAERVGCPVSSVGP